VNADTQFQIAERAYFIWKQKGCPDGKALDNWLQAEAELSAAKTSDPAVLAQTSKSDGLAARSGELSRKPQAVNTRPPLARRRRRHESPRPPSPECHAIET
jgi:hypothetical protein